MSNSSVLSLLGFAAKAGKLSFGTHASGFAIESGRARLIVAANDISAKSVKELNFKAGKKNIPVIITEGIDTATLSGRVGKNCGILAVLDRGFADAVLKANSAEEM